MIKHLFFWLFLLITSTFVCKAGEVDSLLNVLDKVIENRSFYDGQRQLRIDSLKTGLKQARTDEEKYGVCRSLFGEYRSFRMDSALWVANQRLALAKKMGSAGSIQSSNMNIAEILAAVGMYKEALDILNSIDRSTLSNQRVPYYFHIYHSIYTLMSDYAFSDDEKERYRKLMFQYKDSLLSISSPRSHSYQIIESGKLITEGKHDEALAILLRCYDDFKQKGYGLAVPACGLAEIYRCENKPEEEKKYLAISAISDLRSSVKEYISLWQLAALLSKQGDVKRAYNYMKCSMEDAIFCNARYRALEISSMLPLINAAYDMKMKQETTRITVSLILISILSLFLLGTIFYIYKQLKKLSQARKSMKQMNEELKQMNKELLESNVVKEEYIGYVFNLCSNYIDKLDDFRKGVNRKIKAGQIEDVVRVTSLNSFAADELKEFFRSFDTIFLNLYPDFIEEFNALLQEGERILPKDGELLTPELRIFALVRLGINDSTKIASFLHYSPQTVYNYRLRVRNKAVVSKEDFPSAVQRIGSGKG